VTLAVDQDFHVTNEHGILRAHPKNLGATSAFKTLQITVRRAIEQIPEAPAVVLEVDGVIGPSLALAVQVIAQRLASGKHHGLAQLGCLQPEDAIPTIAQNAMEIAGYVSNVLEADPTALINPQTIARPPDPMEQLKGLFTPKRIAAALGAIAGLGTLVCFGVAADRRSLGIADRSYLLPPSDGSDEFDEDELEDDGAEDDGDDGAEGVIDAQAVETSSQAA